jgi:hypothetical protein
MSRTPRRIELTCAFMPCLLPYRERFPLAPHRRYGSVAGASRFLIGLAASAPTTGIGDAHNRRVADRLRGGPGAPAVLVGSFGRARSPALTRWWRRSGRHGLRRAKRRAKGGGPVVISAPRTHPHAPLEAGATHDAGPTTWVRHEPEEANDPANEPSERFTPPGPGHDAPSSDRCNRCRPLEWVD